MQTVGRLEGGERNRYWAIKSHHRVRYHAFSVLSVVGIPFFVLLLPFLYGAALLARWHTSRKLTHVPGQAGAGDVESVALACFEDFLQVYPSAVYSPLVKSLELGYFSRYPVIGPSLEIAVGDGFFSSVLCRSRSTQFDFGTDLIYETLNSSKKHGVHRRLFVSDAEDIPFPDNSLSTVIMNNLMHHLPDRDHAATEVWRVLKPGGVFLFTDNLVGWDALSFEQRLLQGVGWGGLARRVSRLKLKLMAQSLLPSEEFWKRDAVTERWDVVELQRFVGSAGMTISSIFEILNLKFGQPTWRPLRRLLRSAWLRRRITGTLVTVVRNLIVLDAGSSASADAAFLFVALRKRGPVGGGTMLPLFVCPGCKGELTAEGSGYLRCATCGHSYPVVDGVPILLSYWEKVSKLTDYLMFHRNASPRDYVT